MLPNKTVSVAPFEDITPKKLNFKAAPIGTGSQDDAPHIDEKKKEEPAQKVMSQQQCLAIPHPDSIFQQIKIDSTIPSRSDIKTKKDDIKQVMANQAPTSSSNQ